ncbi:MAG: acetate kinase [Clostridia bacterium]|nr:acetate kinase [Clostridia bacterium]
MKILVINCGSSSLKYQLINMDNDVVMAKGLVERIAIPGTNLTHRPDGKDKVVIEKDLANHAEAFKLVVDSLLNPEYGVISDMSEINAVGHRVVHGGEYFSESVLINDEVIEAIEKCCALAPLHNPANLIGIRACAEVIPGVPQVAVFDTAFHQTMPKEMYMYAIPYKYYEKYKIRRYGFHGTSHKYVAGIAAKMLNKPIEETKIITCHLGNGSSITAVQGGKSLDTTMGFTPLDGLLMGSRCGSIDPAIIPFLMEKEGLDAKAIDKMMNKESGVEGLMEDKNDFRDIEIMGAEGHERAQMILDMFRNQVVKYIGSYAALMGGVDAIVFTAGVGENNKLLRATVAKQLSFMGVEIDEEKNNVRGKLVDMSTPNAKVKMMLIPTNEELAIAVETAKFV